jgi:hypothetical protein
MSKNIRHASHVIIVVLFVIAGYGLSSKVDTDSAGRVASAEVQTAAPTADAESSDVLVPEATCAAIKCPPGQFCVNSLVCTPNGDCFHVGRCVSGP